MRPNGSLRFWAWPSELRAAGVLGINNRNVSLMFELNERNRYPRVDDKLQTKSICQREGIPIPATQDVITRLGDLKRLPACLGGAASLVIKPARGAAGRGVMVLSRCGPDECTTASGDRLVLADVRQHVSDILSGLYSLGGRPDRAMVEEFIRPHASFDSLTVDGTPDVRVIVARGVPAMAMLRMPTRASRGRANLHQGALAAGIDLTTGMTRGGVQYNRTITHHPDTGRQIAGFSVPSWRQILDISSRLARALELGYVGIDIVVDDDRGAIVLEANARPGLSIQIANRQGLLDALQRVASGPTEDGPKEEHE